MSKAKIKEISDKAYDAICDNDLQSALNSYYQILAIDSNDDSSLHFLAFILNLQGKYKTALDMVKRAIDRYRCSATYYVTLASICRNLGDYKEAVDAIKTACELKPNDPIILSNAAMILADERKYDKAKDIYELALEFEPNNAFLHFNYSLLLLTIGDFENGWREYEWRIPLHHNGKIQKYPKDLKGKKVKIIPEQGYGDFIMFSRYFKLLEEAGASVFINCPRALNRLYECHYCPDPDFSIYIMSLPILFKEIPNDPYIKAPGILKVDDNCFKVGVITCAVKPANNSTQVVKKADGTIGILPHPENLAYLSTFKRSLPHDFLDPFQGIDKVKFYNLQKDHNCYGMENPRISDFGDLADYVNEMDLIITIDTALAHLAGAMGKKVWLLLPYDFDWRWQADKDYSVWYPTMKIFRQRKRGDWNSVQENLVSEFHSLVSTNAKLVL
jgi:tetratricopeptide (TPR) repeat protein